MDNGYKILVTSGVFLINILLLSIVLVLFTIFCAMFFTGRKIIHFLRDKGASDEQLMSMDKTSWYYVETSKLSPLLYETYHPFALTAGTEDFLQRSLEVSNSPILQIFYALTTTILSFFLTKTNTNGILGRGEMFLFDEEQIGSFLNIDPNWDPRDKYVLDLGAGDGRITQVLSNFYNNVYATDASRAMEWRLGRLGFKVLAKDKWETEGPFHLVSVLNLLDRYYDPAQLLRNLYKLTSRSKSYVLMAVVLPIYQYVEFHPNRKSSIPDTFLNISGRTFEEQANSLVEDTFMPHGFEVVRWGKLPYLCEGDYVTAYYILSDALFLLRPIEGFYDNMPREGYFMTSTSHDSDEL